MSFDNNDDNDDNNGSRRVTDEEGTVDEKVKQRILNARERIDDREDQLFVQAQADPHVKLSYQEATQAWATTVRQYIRAVKPLLTSEKVPEADFYYRGAPLGSIEVPPPDSEKEWSQFARTDDPYKLIKNMGLPPAFDPPEAKEASFTGLKDILERQSVTKRWQIDMEPNSMRPDNGIDTPTAQFPVPKDILERAVETTDAFLQEAGVGLEIGAKQKDEREDNPF